MLADEHVQLPGNVPRSVRAGGHVLRTHKILGRRLATFG